MMSLFPRSIRLRRLHYKLHIQSLHRSQHHYSTQPIQLRPYQEEALAACQNALQSGSTRIAVSLPTGAGKTVVFLTLLSRFQPPADRHNATRSLVIVGTVLLAEQVHRQARTLLPEWSVEIEQGGEHHASGSADLTVATYQSLSRPERLTKFDPQFLKAVVVDEAHHAAAPTYLEILSKYTDVTQSLRNAQCPQDPIPVIGFTATFRRADKRSLLSLFELVYYRSLQDLILEGWLSFLRFTFVKAHLDLYHLDTGGAAKEFNPKSLSGVIDTEANNEELVKTWKARAGTRRSTLVFCVNLIHVDNLTKTFRDAGIDARSITSKTPKDKRAQLISDFKAGEYPVLVNCNIVLEGADIPCIDCVTIARPTTSPVTLSQMIGRGTRHSPQTSKQDCLVIMIVDTSERNAAASVRDACGFRPDDPSYHRPGPFAAWPRNNALYHRKISRRRKPRIRGGIHEFALVDSDINNELDEGKFGVPRHVLDLSKYGWIGLTKNIYVLDCFGNGFLRVQPVVGDGRGPDAVYYASFSSELDLSSTFNAQYKAKQIVKIGPLADVLKAADRHARRVVPRLDRSRLFRTARWRMEPATGEQMRHIDEQRDKWTRLENSHPITGDPLPGKTRRKTEEDVLRLKKGQASNIQIRLKHTQFDDSRSEPPSPEPPFPMAEPPLHRKKRFSARSRRAPSVKSSSPPSRKKRPSIWQYFDGILRFFRLR